MDVYPRLTDTKPQEVDAIGPDDPSELLHVTSLGLVDSIDRIDRTSGASHLDNDLRPGVVCDQIDLTSAYPHVGVNDHQTLVGEILGGKALAQLAEGWPGPT